MALRKIDAMHQMFGFGNGLCKDCSHFQTHLACSRKVFKCDVYGETASEASDWRKSYKACGLFNKPWDGFDIIEILKHSKRAVPKPQMDGQITFNWDGGTF